MTDYDGYRILLLTFASIGTIASSIILSSVVYHFWIIPCNRRYRQRVRERQGEQVGQEDHDDVKNEEEIRNSNENSVIGNKNSQIQRSIQDVIDTSNKIIKFTTIIALVSFHQGLLWYFIANIALHTDVFEVTTDVNEDDDKNNISSSEKWFDIARVLSFIFWFIGYLFIFIVLLARLHEISKLSHFSYPKYVFVSLQTMYVLFCFVFVVVLFLYLN